MIIYKPYIILGTAEAAGDAMEPTDQGQSSVDLVTPEVHTKVNGDLDESSPPKVRCPCGVHEVWGIPTPAC